MSYEILARKWRPQIFDEVVGQDHITRTLKKAVELGRISHAYLFSGPRGCGKTSTARILAKVINCSDLKGGNPCDVCPSCVGVTQGKNLDVMEIDGASHTGVAEVRDLQESIGYAPSQYRNKIYIIDEVHMLSNHAFNALLKTLEEPPKHVYFVFATTAPHKIPETIKSRCQRHHFKRLEIGEIAGQLEKVCKAEKVKYEKDALRLLARKAEGSMRDGESLLDQCITASSGEVSTAAVADILGLLDGEMVLAFLERISKKDPSEVLKQLDRVIDEGVDLQELAGALLEGFRDLMILTVPGDLGDLLFRSKDEIASLKDLAGDFELPDLVTIVERLCNITPRLKSASDPRILLESLLVDISLLDRQTDIRDLIERLESGSPQGGGLGKASSAGKTRSLSKDPGMAEEGDTGTAIGGGKHGGSAFPGAARLLEGEISLMPGLSDATPSPEAEAITPPDRVVTPVSDLDGMENKRSLRPGRSGDDRMSHSFRKQWEDFVTCVRQKKVSLGVCLVSAKLTEFDGKTVQLKFPKGFLIQKEQVENPQSIQFLKRMMKKFFGREMDISCSIAGEEDAPSKRSTEEHRETGEFKSQRNVEQQPIIKKILEDFDGEIVQYHP